MASIRKMLGQTTDITFSWLTKEYGDTWLQWQQYAADWMATQESGIASRLVGLQHFFSSYLVNYASYASDVIMLFKGCNGHHVSTEEFIRVLEEKGSKQSNYKYVSHVVAFIDYIAEHHFNDKDELGDNRPIVINPFTKIKKNLSNTETVHNPLPYRFIIQLREILCPYRKRAEQPVGDRSNHRPWLNHHFHDWKWAIANIQGAHGASWLEVEPKVIDQEDPDCVWRKRKLTRNMKQVTIYEIWTPVAAMLLFCKLHLPLRTYQVRFLDSGEADTWRYQKGKWVKNTNDFTYGNEKRPYSRGVFKRIYDSFTGTYSTGLYISTNKTADQNKNEVDHGYTIPWQHEEVLYWLEKLRNWQEKYNPITGPVCATTLKRDHLQSTKTHSQKQSMGEFCFLFRDASARDMANKIKPIKIYRHYWYMLLSKLEEDLAKSGHTLNDSSPLTLVKPYPANTKIRSKVETDFSLHSLRVSLITCYSMDTDLPLPVISKLLAGHTRLLMTIYYNKITPSVMAQKMQEAQAVLKETSEESLRLFLRDAELNQIQARAVYNSEESIIAALVNRNPISWVQRFCGICLVGGNTVRTDEITTAGGCWNGGPIIKDAESPVNRIYGPVPHGVENCPRCRWFITDASYLPALNVLFNQTSYKAHQAASLAADIEWRLEKLRDEKYFAEEQGLLFTKHAELQQMERRYEKQRVEADEFAKDYIAQFNLIKRITEIENQRERDDDGQKLVAVGTADDLKVSMRFIETNSELLHLSLLCEDAELYPDMLDDLRKTPAITKRTVELSRMMMRQGYKPILMEMDEDAQLVATNAMMRKMSLISHPTDKFEGYRIATNYIEAQKYLTDARLLEAGIDEMQQALPMNLSDQQLKLI